MKIAIDVSQVLYETGVSVYTRNLVRSLLKIDSKNDYVLFGGSLRRLSELNAKIQKMVGGKSNADSLVLPIPPTMSDILFNRMNFNIDHIFGKRNVFHTSDWTQPRTDAYSVTTVHDLVPVLYPKMSNPKIVEVHKRRLTRVKKYANKIIVPTNATKNDLVRFGVEDSKIVVIPEALDTEMIKPNKIDAQKILRKYHLSEDYLLVVGASQRKNVDRIISAFEKVRSDHSLKLVIVGEAKRQDIIRNVIYLGHIPRFDLIAIFSQAKALLYPSLYEGFGLPILEAFYLGVPVLTSDSGSLKEISQNAALLVDPNEIEDIVSGIRTLLKDRSKYIKLGKEVVKRFSWDENARKTLEIYQEALD